MSHYLAQWKVEQEAEILRSHRGEVFTQSNVSELLKDD
jgi:hypothetical protein